MPIKSIIIDDDPFMQSLLWDKLNLHVPNVTVIDTADSGSEGIEKIKIHQPDLIFLDVELADMTGFEMLGKIDTTGFQTIFITSHNHYAIKALRVNALDYLVKPIDPEELKEAVQKFQTNARNKARTETIKQALNNLEALVLNVLPKEIAAEIQQNGLAKTSNRFEQVSVLFTDIQGFTEHSERLSPEELVAELDHCYCAFDQIVELHGVEKIKTIGDAYMAAGGVPTANTSNPDDTLKAALAIRDFMRHYQNERKNQGRIPFEIRIGVHTGPVVAGIVGIKKFAYDIWGDTVNIAAQMEHRGAVGKVNVSQRTYELLRESAEYVFTSRGKMEVKGKGELEMYFVEMK